MKSDFSYIFKHLNSWNGSLKLISSNQNDFPNCHGWFFQRRTQLIPSFHQSFSLVDGKGHSSFHSVYIFCNENPIVWESLYTEEPHKTFP